VKVAVGGVLRDALCEVPSGIRVAPEEQVGIATAEEVEVVAALAAASESSTACRLPGVAQPRDATIARTSRPDAAARGRSVR